MTESRQHCRHKNTPDIRAFAQVATTPRSYIFGAISELNFPELLRVRPRYRDGALRIFVLRRVDQRAHRNEFEVRVRLE
jgi:hypothetical protein